MSVEPPSGNSSPLAPYLATPLKLFVHDRTLADQLTTALAQHGFASQSRVAVKAGFFEAMRQLYGELTGFDGLVLVNHPPKKVKGSSGISDQDMAFADFYQGVASFNTSSRRSTADLLGKCLPVFVSPQDADIRMRIVSELFGFGIMAVFMLSVQPLGMSKEDQLDERKHELGEYLLEYFETRDRKAKEYREYKSAEELAQRRAEAERLMAEVEQQKAAGDFEKAIALCRQATEVLPTDPDAYLEGGRLLVKRKKYPPAMQMFRDAEKVAEDLPAPNREIAALRIAQVKDHVSRRRQAGQAVDEQKVAQWMAEAVEGYETALGKAEKIRGVDAQAAAVKRTDAQAGIAEDIMTQNLGAFLGENSEHVNALNRLARDTLQEKLKDEDGLDPRYLAQFGLMAFQDGKVDEAERLLVQAAGNPDTFQEACTKLNYIGTQLRGRGRSERAIAVYQTLLDLKPPFLGVALFNLAVAQRTLAADLEASDRSRAAGLDLEALAGVVQALYVDPRLPEDENFYRNTAVAPQLKRAQAIFAAAAKAQAPAPRPAPAGGPVDAACQQATRQLDALLAAGKEREALKLLYKLARSLKPYFLKFERHASEAVKRFAERLVPRLARHPDPKMQVFGKVLAVLVARAGQAAPAPDAELDPAFAPVNAALEQGDQALAARELARVLASQPRLVGAGAHAADATILNLCREISRKLAGAEVARFFSRAA